MTEGQLALRDPRSADINAAEHHVTPLLDEQHCRFTQLTGGLMLISTRRLIAVCPAEELDLVLVIQPPEGAGDHDRASWMAISELLILGSNRVSVDAFGGAEMVIDPIGQGREWIGRNGLDGGTTSPPGSTVVAGDTSDTTYRATNTMVSVLRFCEDPKGGVP